jgi:isopentenyl-diphosphate delta-isomerase
MLEEKVILVDIDDNSIGSMSKIEAHEKAILHRAFSVFILNKKGQLMLQQRSLDKYHSPGLWTNTCCSHQREGEGNIDAGKRRLKEEMGFTVPMKALFSFIYKAPFDNGLTEHELDYVLLGYYNYEPIINSNEVAAWKWIDLDQIAIEIKDTPQFYTVWFKIIFDRFYKYTTAN